MRRWRVDDNVTRKDDLTQDISTYPSERSRSHSDFLAVVKPTTCASMIDSDEDTAHAIGFGGLGNALRLFASDNAKLANVHRSSYNFGDALVFGRRKRAVAASARSFATIGVLALTAE
jgi:hypothetical protein